MPYGICQFVQLRPLFILELKVIALHTQIKCKKIPIAKEITSYFEAKKTITLPIDTY